MRYLRQSKAPGRRASKPYYLLSEMSFMETFVRHGDQNESKFTGKILYKVEEHADERIVYIRKTNEDPLEQSAEYTTEILDIKRRRTEANEVDDQDDDDDEEDEDADDEVAHHQETVVTLNAQRHIEDMQLQQQQHQEVSVAPQPPQQQHMHQQEQQQAGTSTSGQHIDSLLAELAHPDLAFFRSILGDIETMTLPQKAKFKHAVLTSLNNILYP